LAEKHQKNGNIFALKLKALRRSPIPLTARTRSRLRPQELAGKKLALLLHHVPGEERTVITGVVRLEEDTVFLERGENRRFEIRKDWWDRILVVEHEQAKTILRGADLCLPLTVSDNPEG